MFGLMVSMGDFKTLKGFESSFISMTNLSVIFLSLFFTAIDFTVLFRILLECFFLDAQHLQKIFRQKSIISITMMKLIPEYKFKSPPKAEIKEVESKFW